MILVCEEILLEDVDGMYYVVVVLIVKGGMIFYVVFVIWGWGKCCIVGCNGFDINEVEGYFIIFDGVKVKEGDYISFNGVIGKVYFGSMFVVDVDLADNDVY